MGKSPEHTLTGPTYSSGMYTVMYAISNIKKHSLDYDGSML